MWLSILVVIGLVGGIAISFVGMGPIGVVIALIALVGIGAKAFGAFAGQGRSREQQDPAEPLGPAHEGQAHMTPEKI